MRRSLAVLTLVSMATIATLTLVSASLSHVQAMRVNGSIMGSAMHHMNQDNHTGGDENMSTYMNGTQRMPGNMYDECEEIHDSMNVTEHMKGMP